MSVIDRWATHPLLIKAIGSRISDEINKFPESDRDDVVILFSAHSLPLKVNKLTVNCILSLDLQQVFLSSWFDTRFCTLYLVMIKQYQ